MAFSVGAIEGTLELNRTPFQRSLQAARAEAKRFSSERIAPEVDLADRMAKTQIDELNARLDKLRLKHVEIKVDVDRSALSRVESIFGSLGSGAGRVPFIGGLLTLPFKAVEGLTAGLQKLPGLLENIGQFATQAFTTVTGTINDLRTGATTVGEVLGSVVSGLVSIVASGGATLLLAGALVIAFAAVASVVVSLVAALAALAASFGAAVLGAGALFIGALAPAAPVIGVLIAFFIRLTAVLKAHQAAEQAAKQAAQQHTQVLQAQHQAIQGLQQAQQNLKAQTVAAWQAMKQSAIDYQHALLGVEQSKLGIEGARLSLRQAKQDLRDFLQTAAGANSSQLFKAFTNVDFNPESARKIFERSGQHAGGDQLLALQEKLFAVKQASLGVKQANQSYQDSLNQLSTSEAKHNAFLKQGIDAYKPYRDAVDQVAKARERLKIATDRVSSAQFAYEQKLKALSATERGFLGTLTKIEQTFSAIAKQVAAPIFRGLESGFGSISKLVADPAIQRGLVGIGQAIGDVIAKFGRTLSTKPWRDAISQFLSAGAQLTRSGGRAFGGFMNVLRQIAQAALPHVINGVKALGDWFVNLGKKPAAIKSAVEFLVHQFKIWWDVAKALGGLIVAFMRNAAGSGGRLATHIASILRHWTNWLNKNPDAVRKFFDDAVASTDRIFKNLGGIVQAMKTLAGIVNAPANAGKYLGKIFFGVGDSKDVKGSTLDNALKAIHNTHASVAARINAGLAALQLDVGSDARNEIEKTLREIGYHGSFSATSYVRHAHPAHQDRGRRRPVHARGSSAGIEFHAHGIQDPQHFIAQSAAKVAKHPAFGRAQIDESVRRGE